MLATKPSLCFPVWRIKVQYFLLEEMFSVFERFRVLSVEGGTDMTLQWAAVTTQFSLIRDPPQK